jgi:hypothetical protein
MRYYLNKRISIAISIAQNILDDIPCGSEAAFAPECISCDSVPADRFIDFYNEGLRIEKALTVADSRIPGECGRWREDAAQSSGFLSIFWAKLRSMI